MNIVIVTWGKEGKYLFTLLNSKFNNRYYVKWIADENSSVWGVVENSKGENIKIGSLARAAAMFSQKIIDYFLIPSLNENPNRENIVEKIKNRYEIPESAFLYAPISIFKNNSLNDEEKLSEICSYSVRRELDFLEFHVADHCNLNCKNCSMFSGLVEGKVFADYDKTRNGLLKLKTFFDHVKVFRIIGGEPLLNDRLSDYIDLVRLLYPFTDIRVITNGILVRSMKPTLIESLKNNKVSFIVTGYPALENSYDEIADFLRKNEIRHVVGPTIYKFQKIYNKEGNSDTEKAFFQCNWKGTCANIKENRIATCFVPFVLPYFTNNFKLMPVKDDTIDLYEEGLSTEKIHSRLSMPMDACRYCTQKRMIVDWELTDGDSKTCLEDWAV